jgi:hypothetical protein
MFFYSGDLTRGESQTILFDGISGPPNYGALLRGVNALMVRTKCPLTMSAGIYASPNSVFAMKSGSGFNTTRFILSDGGAPYEKAGVLLSKPRSGMDALCVSL